MGKNEKERDSEKGKERGEGSEMKFTKGKVEREETMWKRERRECKKRV